MEKITAAPEELLEAVRAMYPREFDRAVAEVTMRKQAARIAELEAQLQGAASEQGDDADTPAAEATQAAA